MKTAIHPVAFAALLIPSLLSASTIDVTFDAALTNTTDWVYSEKIQRSSAGGEHVYFNTLGSYVRSPVFPFRVTSVRLELSCSSATPTRHLAIVPSAGESLQSADVSAKEKREFQTFAFDGSDAARSFDIVLTGSGQTGNWHLYSATISGVPIVPPPSELHAGDVGYNRFTLSWVNPEGAVSNRIDVSKVLRSEATGVTIEDFGFDEISAGGNPKDFETFRGSLPPHYEKLSGSNLYAATNSTGLLMISTGKDRGMLVHSGFASYAGLTLCMTLKRYCNDANTMTVGWTNGGATTNLIATVDLGNDFATEFISLSEADDGARLVFNYSGNADQHRVIIDEISFIRGYSPAGVATNLVKSVFAAGSPARARGLSPSTDYIVTVSAFDAEGNESDFSDPLAVRTLSTIPTRITLR